jgi:haloalkane dehalogenase
MAIVDNRPMHLVDEGEGRPVLLLHGNPTWSFLWRKVLHDLRGKGLRLIAPDLFGFGLSDKPRHL